MPMHLSTDLSTETVENAARTGEPPTEQPAGLLQVVLDMPRAMPFDYLPPPGVEARTVPPGSRVRVPVGRSERIGYVIGWVDTASVPAGALKAAREILDPAP